MTLVFRSRRRGLNLRPVNRIKHVVDSQDGVILNTVLTKPVIITSDTPTLGATQQVETGSTVNAIYLKVEVYATTAAALANVYMYVNKNPGNGLTMPNPNVVGADDNKKYVIHQEMIMLEQKVNGNPRTLFNGVIVIPRGYRRNGPNDRLEVRVFSPGVNINVCIQTHYKEFR